MVNGIGLGPDVKSCLATRGRKIGGTDLWGPPVGDQKRGTRLPAKGEREDGAGWPFGPREGSEACCARWAEGKQKGEVFFLFVFFFVSFYFKTI